VEPTDLPTWAEQQAAVLLGSLGDRWTHVQGVVAQARQVSVVLAPEDRPYLAAAAWLHDIGYAPPLDKLGFHPVDGARYMRQQGHERLASLVAYHSGARFEAEERGLVAALAEFAPDDGPLLDALTYADMTTGPAGAPAGRPTPSGRPRGRRRRPRTYDLDAGRLRAGWYSRRTRASAERGRVQGHAQKPRVTPPRYAT